MDFEELFENNRKRQHHHNQHADHNTYSDNHQHGDSRWLYDKQAYMGHSDFTDDHTRKYQGHYSRKKPHQNQWIGILETLKNNKKLRTLALIAGFVILAIIILLVVAFLPVIKSLVQYLMDSGLKGLIDGIAGFIEKIGNSFGK
jgi:hypothetical protein